MEYTKESQYQQHISLRDEKGLSPLGIRANATWYNDPRRLTFVLSRYKFVAKMLSGKSAVLEVGCGDGFATRIVLQEVESLYAIDFDPVFVKSTNELMDKKWTFDYKVHDILDGPIDSSFDAAYALDVLEHITKDNEQVFLRNIIYSLNEHGVLIIGMPSIQSQIYASEGSKAGHVNCKDGNELKDLMKDFFHNVFLFSMNDEVVHTGFSPMAHYLFVIGVSPKSIYKNNRE